MDFQIGVEQTVDQEIGAKMNAIAAIGLEQDGARHQPLLQQDAGVEPKIGADIDEDVRFNRRRAAHEVFQLGILGDLGGDFEPADIDRAHQKLGAEIAADEFRQRGGKKLMRKEAKAKWRTYNHFALAS